MPFGNNVYLKQNIQFEPLFNQWYAWFLSVPPVTASLNIAERYLPIMKSYVASPMMHATACKNPAMKGGPFIDLDGKRVDEIRDLITVTMERSARLIEFAKGFKQLSTLVAKEAQGFAMDPIYPQIPDVLKGYVELYYDLNHNPSFRVFETMLYASPYYEPEVQSIALSAIDANTRRPFILSTPRLKDDGTIIRRMPFASPEIDTLFHMRDAAGSYTEIAEKFGITGDIEPLFRTFFTEEAPAPKDDRSYDGDGFRIRYYGHACVLIQARGVNIMLDPAVSYGYETDLPRYTFADLPERIDYALITHSHHDHIILETLLQLRHRIGTVVVGRNCDGFPQDPSLQLALRRIGFPSVMEVRDNESIPVPGGCITAIPFMGEHNDLAIQSKNAYFVRIGNHSVLGIADSCNLDPTVYDHIFRQTGEPDILFLGMECEGAPPSWVFGPLFPKPLPRDIDHSRRARGCNIHEAKALVDRFHFKQVYIYAMGQEPWLNHILDNEFSEDSPSLIQSRTFVNYCRSKGIESESLYAQKEIFVASAH